mmetsp:Transcript_21143/g.72948  ORF Transcript_21143/g.72948 Transcript_21143/m.72948 type:complete len:200 (-) Transcript_21143:1391-1990(-)
MHLLRLDARLKVGIDVCGGPRLVGVADLNVKVRLRVSGTTREVAADKGGDYDVAGADRFGRPRLGNDVAECRARRRRLGFGARGAIMAVVRKVVGRRPGVDDLAGEHGVCELGRLLQIRRQLVLPKDSRGALVALLLVLLGRGRVVGVLICEARDDDFHVCAELGSQHGLDAAAGHGRELAGERGDNEAADLQELHGKD